ncbi:MAG TPA: hypothetical protein EYG80_02950 [Flavobacteriaceae bacterium]|nr:hypothetical protein [Flavobacteriaceae bacterium]
MNKVIFSGVVLCGLTVYSYAGLPEVIADKVADLLTTKINADKEVSIEALKNSLTITIDGELYNYVTINAYNHVLSDERVVMVGNAGVVLLGDKNISSMKDIVDIKKKLSLLVIMGFTSIAIVKRILIKL